MAKTRRRVRKSVARSRRVRVRTRSHMRGKAKTRKTKRRSRKSTRVRRHRKLKGGATAGQTQKATYSDMVLGKGDDGETTYLYTITLPEASFVSRERVTIEYTIVGGERYEAILTPGEHIFRAYFAGEIITLHHHVTKKRVHIHCGNDRDCTGKYKCVDGACVEVSEYYLSGDENAAKRAAPNEDSVPTRPPTRCGRWGQCFK